MGDPRTKLDILYHDVLGEVRDIVERLEALKTDLASTTEGATSKLDLHAASITEASTKLQRELKASTTAVKVEFSAATKAMIEVMRRGQADANAGLGKLATQISETQAAQAESSRLAAAHLKRQLLALTLVLGVSCALNVACLAFWLSP